MKRLHHNLIRGGAFAASFLIDRWMSTLEYRVAYHDPVIDPAYVNDGQRRIYLFWHEYIVFLLYLRKNCQFAMLLSQHRDADVLEEVAHSLGFATVRGSTSRGGAKALLEMSEKSKQYQLTITPDGPRGPRRTLAQGAIYLASKLQYPLVLLGLGYEQPWRLNSWDQFAVPRPFSRARCIASGDIHIPPNLNRAGIEHYRLYAERILNELTDEAENWATQGYSIRNESTVFPGPKFSMIYPSLPKQAQVEQIQKNI